MSNSEKGIPQSGEWKDFHEEKMKGNYPKWPNEPMLKSIFGSYSRNQIKPKSSWRVLDVGCGFGNNLVPFADLGCECFGVEIDQDICELAQKVLGDRGYKATIKKGSNRSLPFEDATFDLLLSVATIHYEGEEKNIAEALKEFRRVLKPGGQAYIATVGPSHDIYQRAQLLGNHRYRIQDYDFRNGQEFFFFDNERYLAQYCSGIFEDVQTGRIRETLFSHTVDHLIALCR